MDIRSLVKLPKNPKVPAVNPGDTVRVTVKVIEGEKQRSQAFEGTVIRTRAGGNSESFTVRRVTQGVGVERTFLVHSPLLEKVDVVRRGKVRRARLYYLRDLSAKEARLKAKHRATRGGEASAEHVQAAGAEQAQAAPSAAEVQAEPASEKQAA